MKKQPNKNESVVLLCPLDSNYHLLILLLLFCGGFPVVIPSDMNHDFLIKFPSTCAVI